MKKYELSEFEQVVMLAVALLNKEAYGVSIKREIETISFLKVSIVVLHAVLNRLERKGYLKSRFGGSSPERGGRSKKYFEITESGRISLLFEGTYVITEFKQCFEKIMLKSGPN